MGFGLLLAAALGAGGWLAFCAIFGCAGRVAPPYRPKQPLVTWDNAAWATVLDRAVTPDGYVNYDVLINDVDGTRQLLNTYVGRIEAASPESAPRLFPTEADRLAYYLNAYNALCLYGVLEKGLPRNVLASTLYFTRVFTVGGTGLTLDGLEKEKVRKRGDARVHFALNCMSRSCPPLRREPYEGAKLDGQLADQGRRFLSDPRGAVLAGDTVRLSEILTRFYPEDFIADYRRKAGASDAGEAGLLEAARSYAAPDSPVFKAGKYESMPYDWTINRAP